MPIFTPIHAIVPKTAKPFPRKIRNPQKGTSMCAKAAEGQSQKQQNLFPENKTPRFWDIRQNDPRQMGPFCNHGLIFAN